MFRKGFNIFLFSNSLYGLAAVLLAIEHNLLCGLPLNNPLFYIILFCGTTAFYLYSYQYDQHPHKGNRRAKWISQHAASLLVFRNVLTLVTLTGGIWYFISLPTVPLALLVKKLLLLSIFPLLGLLYYGISFPGLLKLKLRQFGWFKPFTIGSVWAGCVSVMPWILVQWEQYPLHEGAIWHGFLWLHNWMFITVLCILFDIKDYAADHNQQLKTFVVRVGLRKVIFSIVWPLVLLGSVTFFAFMLLRNFSTTAIVLNILPMLMLLLVAQSMQQRRSIEYFLLVIDGLMVVKSVLGIASTLVT
jgi:hypothetical protein